MSQLTYFDKNQSGPINYAFGRSLEGQERQSKSRSRSPKNRQRSSVSAEKKHGKRSRSVSLSNSPKRQRTAASRSRSREGKNFIQRIEKLRKNLEVEGMALAGHYKQAEDYKSKVKH